MQVTLRIAFSLILLTASKLAKAEEPSQSDGKSKGHVNLPTPTLGGKQFWADELVFHQWRIQRNVLTGHYRLLDEDDVRRVWGTFDECRTALEDIKQREKLPPMKGKVVILLHGLGRTRTAMSGMAKFLEESDKYTALNVSYPSTMAEVEEHAKSLQQLIDNLTGVDEIDFVAHSLGNLVIRSYLYDQQNGGENRKPDPRIKRIVMLVAPNNGAQLAVTIGQSNAARELIGVPGRELAEGWESLSKHLTTPKCEFGIIAGGKGDGRGYNPLLSGDNDMVVTVDETRLPGASDFLCLPVIHTFMMDDHAVQEATLNFLQHGYFVADGKRQPIEKSTP